MNREMNLGVALLAVLACTPLRAELKVFACEPEWAALAGELGGDRVDAYSASTALQDVHRIQPRPSLIAKYRQADLVVCTGAELEAGWYPALERKGNNPRVRRGTPGYLEAAAQVEMLDVPGRVDRAMGDVHAHGNPHIHTNPHNLLPVAQELSARLKKLDADGAADYETRLQEFRQKWTAAIAQWEQRAAPLKGARVVSHHKTWVYLYAWLGIHEVGTLEPKPGIPPSGGHLEGLLSVLKSQPAKMVVHSSYEDARPSEWLSKHAGIPAVRLPFSVGGVEGADDLHAYYGTIISRLLGALDGKPAT